MILTKSNHISQIYYVPTDIYRVSLYLIDIILEVVVYGENRGTMVYFQVSYTSGKLNCYYRSRGSSSWEDFNSRSTYYSEYAECSEWSKGNLNYDIKLQLNGMELLTDEETAITKGPYPKLGNVHKTKGENSRIF